MMIKACKICNEPINESEKWRYRTCRKCHNEMWKNHNKKYRDSHREEIKERNKQYRKSHKEYYNQIKSNYVYVIIYNNEVSYVGSTTNINNRISYHINGYSNIDEKWNYIYYLDVTNMLTDEITLQLLEQLLFDHFKPEFNVRNPIDKTSIPESKQKMELVLQQLLNSKEWKMYYKVHEVLRAIGGERSI